MVISLLAAVLVSAAFAPISIWWLGVLGYSLFLRGVSKSSRPTVTSFIFGFVSSAIILHWSSKYVGALPWLLLSALQALFYIPLGWIYRRTQSLWWVLFSLLALEELRARFPFGGFAWTRIAFGQVDSPLLATVSIGGVLALSAVTLVISLCLTRLRIKNLVFLLAILISSLLLPSNSKSGESINLLAIQGNTPQVGLEFNSRAKAVFQLHRDLTLKSFDSDTGSGDNMKYDAIVWPENAIDIDPANHPDVAFDIAQITQRAQMPLIAGVVLATQSGPQNASVMYGLGGGEESTYIKRGLTPFGEYMPLRAIAEFVSPLAETVTDFQPGSALQTHNINGASLGPIICYEIILDRYVREMAKQSSALIVQTNSATFAGTAESRQQLAITRIRAVEHGRAILSVSTIGISAFIDNNGSVISQTREDEEAVLAGRLFTSDKNTIANDLGFLGSVLVLLFFGSIAIFDTYRRTQLRFRNKR